MKTTIDISKKDLVLNVPPRLLGQYIKLKLMADGEPSILVRNTEADDLWGVSRRQFYVNLNGFRKCGLASITWTHTNNPFIKVQFEV